MDNQIVINKKKNSNIIEEFSKLFVGVLNDSNNFSNENHRKLIYWLTRYAAKSYNINFIELIYENSNYLNSASSDENKIHLPSGLLTCDDFEEFLFQSILNVFHESNHVYIVGIEENFKKGLDGKVNMKLTSNGCNALLEYFASQNYTDGQIEYFKDHLYFSSASEICAYVSSCKLGFKFLNEVKEYFKANNITDLKLLNKLELKLKDELELYNRRIKNAKDISSSLVVRLPLYRAISELQEESIYEILTNRNISKEKYEAFKTSIREGYFEKDTIEKYKKSILINKMGINKTRLFCDLINIDTYKINKQDLISAISLIENDKTLKDSNNYDKLKNIKSILFNIDEKVIENVFGEMHNKEIEK